jgi:hypothetical protein
VKHNCLLFPLHVTQDVRELDGLSPPSEIDEIKLSPFLGARGELFAKTDQARESRRITISNHALLPPRTTSRAPHFALVLPTDENAVPHTKLHSTSVPEIYCINSNRVQYIHPIQTTVFYACADVSSIPCLVSSGGRRINAWRSICGSHRFRF